MHSQRASLVSADFEIVCDSSQREAWLAARMKTIGASESAAVLGQHPWLSELELWAIKTGQAEPENLDDNEAVFWGNELESAIVTGYAKRTNRVSVPFGLMLRSTRYPWLSATPDALTTDDPEAAKRATELISIIKALRHTTHSFDAYRSELLHKATGWWPLQIKNIGFGSAEHWADGVPSYYRIQCTQEAMVWGATRCTGAALIAGQRLAWDDVEVPTGGTLPTQLAGLTKRFWDENVQGGLQPSPDASESAKRALAALYPIERPELVLQLGLDHLEMAREHDQIKAERARLKKRQDEIENELRAAIGEAATCIFADGTGYTLKTIHKKAYAVDATSYRDLRRKKPKETRP